MPAAPAAPVAAPAYPARPRVRPQSAASVTLVLCRIEASDDARLVSELEALLSRAEGPTRECIGLLLESARARSTVSA